MSNQKHVLLCGNWKMNFGPKETQAFLEKLEWNKKSNAQMRIYVPYVSLTTAQNTLEKRGLLGRDTVSIGAQNVHYEKSGAFTGEISALMLTEVGIRHTLVGHSERRQYFNETNETVLKRTVHSLEQGLEVLLCIGETLNERNSNQTESVLTTQLAAILDHATCQAHFGDALHLAYEPVWAIGTGVVATPSQAEQAHSFIREMLHTKLGSEKALKTRILYGGSVSPQNFKDLLACPNIDGGLVGGASLKLDSWHALWNLI